MLIYSISDIANLLYIKNILLSEITDNWFMQNQRNCNQSIELTSIKSMNISINQSNQEIYNSNCITLPKVKCAFHPQ